MRPLLYACLALGLFLAQRSTLNAQLPTLNQRATTNNVLELDAHGSYVELPPDDLNALGETILQAAGNRNFLRTFEDMFRGWKSEGRGGRLWQNRSFN